MVASRMPCSRLLRLLRQFRVKEVGQRLHGDAEFFEARVLVAQRNLGVGAVSEKGRTIEEPPRVELTIG